MSTMGDLDALGTATLPVSTTDARPEASAMPTLRLGSTPGPELGPGPGAGPGAEPGTWIEDGAMLGPSNHVQVRATACDVAFEPSSARMSKNVSCVCSGIVCLLLHDKCKWRIRLTLDDRKQKVTYASAACRTLRCFIYMSRGQSWIRTLGTDVQVAHPQTGSAES